MDTKPYYKLAEWDPRSFCFRDGKRAFATVAEAVAAATRPGKYRVSTVSPSGRTDGVPFDITHVQAVPTAGKTVSPRKAGGLRTRPGPWVRS